MKSPYIISDSCGTALRSPRIPPGLPVPSGRTHTSAIVNVSSLTLILEARRFAAYTDLFSSIHGYLGNFQINIECRAASVKSGRVRVDVFY